MANGILECSCDFEMVHVDMWHNLDDEIPSGKWGFAELDKTQGKMYYYHSNSSLGAHYRIFVQLQISLFFFSDKAWFIFACEKVYYPICVRIHFLGLTRKREMITAH